MTTAEPPLNQQPEPDPSVDQIPRVLNLDPEHAGIRLVLPIVFFGSGIALYFLTISLLANTDGSIGCIAAFVAIGGAILSMIAADRILKAVWPSHRTLTLDAEGLTLRDKRLSPDGQIRLTWDQDIVPLTWRFTIKRGSVRAPKGWIVLGCQLAEDDGQITVYVFAPEKQAQTFPLYERFTVLAAREAVENSKLPLREAAEQRRLLKAETERWDAGYEVRREDFSPLIESLKAHVPAWEAAKPQPTV